MRILVCKTEAKFSFSAAPHYVLAGLFKKLIPVAFKVHSSYIKIIIYSLRISNIIVFFKL